MALTAYLPAQHITAKPGVQIDQQSLKTPLQSSQIQRAVTVDSKQQYALQLGLYSNLSLAAEDARQFSSEYRFKQPITIFTIQESSRAWHTLLLGPIDSEQDALQHQSGLGISSHVVSWPASEKKGKS